MSADLGGVFALPPGVDFATEFVRGFRHRMAGADPALIARTRIWANSGHTLRQITRAFDAAGPMLLPRMALVTDVGARLDGPPLVAPLPRRLELAQMIAALLAARPDLARGQSVPALARSLAALMVDMQSEGCGPQALDQIDPADHARHWQAALAFLRLAAGYYLTGPLVDRPARQRAAAVALADDWAAGRDLPDAPVIVVGSTGSHGATRLLMQAVARLANGAVVLPGYDFHMPAAVWDGIDDHSADHPQARLAAFRAGGVARWTDTPAPSEDRNRLISLALRPAPVTDQWIADGPGLADLPTTTAAMTLIEADQPDDEAAALAALIRAEVEAGRRVTLFADDRGLTRRIAALLDRWDITPDDSAGQRLSHTEAALFLRHLTGMAGQRLGVEGLLILLKHPACATGSATITRPQALRLTRALELDLRRHGPAFPDGAALRAWGARGDGAAQGFARWLAGIVDRINEAETDRAPAPVAARLARLRALADDLAAGPDGCVAAHGLWSGPGGQMVRAVIDHVAEHAALAPDMTPGDFAALIHDELSAQSLRMPGTHPLVLFQGPAEARAAAHGTTILAGLNEGGWPGALTPDPWMSRQMRMQAGLSLPERHIGLSAHDFQQAVAAERVILSRARRNAEAETIPSRWLNRLCNLMAGLPARHGPQALAEMRARGAQWLALGRALGQPPARVAPAPRPCPVPPAPPFAELPVTDIATLIRDPYAIYAKRVLGLRALDPLRAEPGAALRGQVLHRIVEAWLTPPPPPDIPAADLRDRLIATSRRVMAEDVPWPAARAFWLARIESIADRIVTDERTRLAEGTPAVTERQGRVTLAGMGFTLTARPDRIDLRHDGTAHVFDYKSGAPPSQKQIDHYDKQLPLTAAMVERGGFDALGPVDVGAISYVQLGGAGETHPRALPDGGESWDRFVALIAAYMGGQAGFVSLRAPVTRDEAGEYAHLARFGEWDLTVPASPVRVGDHGDG